MRDARHVEDLAGLALVVGQRDEQVLARRVAVSHLLRDLHGIVQHLQEVLGGYGHPHGAARDFRAVLDRRVDVDLQLLGVGPHALDDGGKVVFSGIEQGLQQVDGIDLLCIGIACDAHRALERLLGGNSELVQSHDRTPPFDISSNLQRCRAYSDHAAYANGHVRNQAATSPPDRAIWAFRISAAVGFNNPTRPCDRFRAAAREMQSGEAAPAAA